MRKYIPQPLSQVSTLPEYVTFLLLKSSVFQNLFLRGSAGENGSASSLNIRPATAKTDAEADPSKIKSQQNIDGMRYYP